MSPSIEELVPLSKTLNAESNDLNITIATISDKLAALNLGIEVWRNSETTDSQMQHEVGFGKVSDGHGKTTWQLASRARGSTYAAPLLSASRDLRIEGLKLIPEIVEELKEEAEERIRIMQEAKKLAAEL
jgi:hypothetical protein